MDQAAGTRGGPRGEPERDHAGTIGGAGSGGTTGAGTTGGRARGGSTSGTRRDLVGARGEKRGDHRGKGGMPGPVGMGLMEILMRK